MKIRLLAILLTGLFIFSGPAKARRFGQIHINGVSVDNIWKAFFAEEIASNGDTLDEFPKKYAVLSDKFEGKDITGDITYKEFKGKMKESFLEYTEFVEEKVKDKNMKFWSKQEFEEAVIGKSRMQQLAEIIELSFTKLKLTGGDINKAIENFSKEIADGNFSQKVKDVFEKNPRTGKLFFYYRVLIMARALFEELHPSPIDSQTASETDSDSEEVSLDELIEQFLDPDLSFDGKVEKSKEIVEFVKKEGVEETKFKDILSGVLFDILIGMDEVFWTGETVEEYFRSSENLKKIIERSFTELKLQDGKDGIKEFSDKIEDDFSREVGKKFSYNKYNKDRTSDEYKTLILARRLFEYLYPSDSQPDSDSVPSRTIVDRGKNPEKIEEIYKIAGILSSQEKSTTQKSAPQRKI